MQKRSFSIEKTYGQQTKERKEEPSSQNTQRPIGCSLLPCTAPYSYSNSNTLQEIRSSRPPAKPQVSERKLNM
jgi:hypothetical protein